MSESTEPRTEPLDLFMSRVEITETCWLWRGTIGTGGYGRAWAFNRRHAAHRLAYELMRGPIAEGMEIDHLCRVRSCVNPAHLEVVSHRENTLRGNTITARQLGQTHCMRGHPFSGPNLRVSKGKRYCRACCAMHEIARRARRKAA